MIVTVELQENGTAALLLEEERMELLDDERLELLLDDIDELLLDDADELLDEELEDRLEDVAVTETKHYRPSRLPPTTQSSRC